MILRMADDYGRIIRADSKVKDISTTYFKQYIREYDILHFSGHAGYDSLHEDDNGLQMCDGKISNAEILDMKHSRSMPALVFANCCQSAGRPVVCTRKSDLSADAAFGLANALLQCGSRHIIVNFACVPDSFSAVFAENFYRCFFQGDTIGAAMQKARSAIIDKYGKGNVAWAGFMLFGDPAYRLPPEKDIAPGKKNFCREDIFLFFCYWLLKLSAEAGF